MGGLSVSVVMGIVVLHIVMHIIDVAFGTPLPRCVGDANPMCGTPIEGFFQLGRQEQAPFSNTFLGRLPLVEELSQLWGAVEAGWALLTGVFSFNYAWLKGDNFFIRLTLWLIQTALGVASIFALIWLAVQGIRR